MYKNSLKPWNLALNLKYRYFLNLEEISQKHLAALINKKVATLPGKTLKNLEFDNFGKINLVKPGVLKKNH